MNSWVCEPFWVLNMVFQSCQLLNAALSPWQLAVSEPTTWSDKVMINCIVPSLNIILFLHDSLHCSRQIYHLAMCTVVMTWASYVFSLVLWEKRDNHRQSQMSEYCSPLGGWPVSHCVTCPHYSNMTLFAAELIHSCVWHRQRWQTCSL